MATLNKHTSVLVANLSDDSNKNFIYILSANECHQRSNEKHFKTNKNQTKSQFIYKKNSWVT